VIFPQELSENINSGKDYIVFFSVPPEVSPGKRFTAQGRGGDVGCPERFFRQAAGSFGGQGKAGIKDRRRDFRARGP